MSDNTSAVAYLRNQGGTKSLAMNDLATDICLWSEKRGMTLVPRYLPGHLNVLADYLSRRGQILKTEWSLNQTVADRIFHAWGRQFVDLFALGKNTLRKLFLLATLGWPGGTEGLVESVLRISPSTDSTGVSGGHQIACNERFSHRHMSVVREEGNDTSSPLPSRSSECVSGPSVPEGSNPQDRVEPKPDRSRQDFSCLGQTIRGSVRPREEHEIGNIRLTHLGGGVLESGQCCPELGRPVRVCVPSDKPD